MPAYCIVELKYYCIVFSAYSIILTCNSQKYEAEQSLLFTHYTVISIVADKPMHTKRSDDLRRVTKVVNLPLDVFNPIL